MKIPLGYRWRSSQWFTVASIAMALFSANFLYSYIVPILQIILEDRLHVEKSQTQAVTSLVLSSHAFVSMLAGPVIGHVADRIPNRKRSLLMGLGAELIGTIIIMISPSVPMMLIGRSIQAIGGNAAWIVGLATLADTVGQENTGKTLGAISSFYSSGVLFGPMASGMLLGLVGYWMTWMAAIAVLAIDILMRVLMIEKNHNQHMKNTTSTSADKYANDIEATQPLDSNEVNEETSLLHASEDEHQDYTKQKQDVTVTQLWSDTEPDSPPSYENFYMFIVTNPRALTALICHASMAVILLSLDTTLPLHATRTFGWSTARVSSMFLILQIPSLMFSTFMGMLKDRVGVKVPTGLGFFTMTFFLWLLGAAGNDGLAFANAEEMGQTVSMVSIAGMGIARVLISGSGIMEITNVMKEAQETHPSRFGPNGKMSSAYSMTNFTWNTGMLIGPIMSGVLVRTVGYYYMNTVIAMISFMVGILALTFLGQR
ncbi:hypothetical protein N7508_009256 [Penicillium antarcticum]|uniref:uncharacterized protein n=1 Tax=Penicillium antarcticum TaxID=416450 RepID=UPI00239204FD|nr:uncharacterized protein N7508_009256 [Penicillium antarcticum]KAJ5294435.1 hypothetical protein N7508_009256 [Penicillium antarcticum]